MPAGEFQDRLDSSAPAEVVFPEEEKFIMSGCHTVEDWKAGSRLAANPVMRYSMALIGIVVFLGSALISLVLLISPDPLSSRASQLLRYSLAIMALLAGPPLINSFRLRRYARKQQGPFAPAHSVIDSSKITTTIEGSKTEYDWSAFSKVKSNEVVALLIFKNSAPPLLLSRRKLHPPATWEDFLNFLDTRVPE